MIFLQILRLLAVMVLAFGAGKLASKLKMPVILGWLIAGMVLGPHALNLLDQQTLDAAWFGSVEHLLECVAGLMIGTELLWNYRRSGDPDQKRRGMQYIIVDLVFVAGAMLGALVTRFTAEKAILTACVLLGAAFAAMFLEEDIFT